MKTKLVIVNIDRSAELLNAPERFSSAERLIRSKKIKNPLVRAQGLAAELALSYALSGEMLLPPEYRREKSGKPVIEDGFISLSHSGRFAVCAYSPVPVGVDIEIPRPVRASVKKRLLSAEELEEWLDGFSLLKRFVIKEAYLKMTGEGVFGGLSSLTVTGGRIIRGGETAAVCRSFDTDEYFLALVSAEDTDTELIEL
ncbi:MAG: 4'-phosphopantetheinyl transferase superfamily protein [Clostridia bacterium]|nr:4'-phosphopantetheinyl transferase superfamily protein [Clostridia bacterium]